jgi:hypothetical protein
MKKDITRSLKLTGKVFLISIACFVLYILLTVVLDINPNSILVLYNPFISGFLHVSLDHFFYNLLGFFIFMVFGINSHYTLKNIFWITFFISLAYLPVSLLGISAPAVGLSGTCMFLIARHFLTWERFKILGILIISFVVLVEVGSIFEDDGVAHWVHTIGAVFGFISLKSKKISDLFSQGPLRSTLLR